MSSKHVIDLWMLSALVGSLLVTTAAMAQDPTELLDQVRSQDWESAHATFWDLPDEAFETSRSVATAIALARGLQGDGQLDRTASTWGRISRWLIDASTKATGDVPAHLRVSVWDSTAQAWSRAGQPNESMPALEAAVSAIRASGDSVAASRLRGTAIGVASGLLDVRELDAAAKVYRWVIELAANDESNQSSETNPPSDLATARLGLAWALTMNGQDDQAALSAIDAFLKHHPDHIDVPSAMLLKFSWHAQHQETEQQLAVGQTMIERFPHDDATVQAVIAWSPSATLNDVAMQPEHPLATYFVEQAEFLAAHRVAAANPRLMARALSVVMTTGDTDATKAIGQALAKADRRGDEITQWLHSVGTIHDGDPAREVVDDWIAASTDLVSITPGAAQAVCRWAGRTAQWSLLADQAVHRSAREVLALTTRVHEEPDPQGHVSLFNETEVRLNLARLFAESLLQTGRTKKSLAWWKVIVDEAGAEDFATRMRLAETAVASDSVAEARRRLAAARGAADADPAQISLIDLLSADVAIRELQFDKGRARLRAIVRRGGVPGRLRGRAQWMIGETYYMQQAFDQAIEAYRLVEGIGRDDEWTAAALVQAGKSFEQLGRTREAAMCYSSLVSRFGNSSYADGAQARLATLRPKGTDSPGSMRR
ncbi:MAG: tetratricopeptide repeat protein [Planctomycetota bacterium]